MRLIEKHGIVTLKADWTHESPEIARWLKRFDSISIPLTVVFPAGRPTQPTVIRDLYTKSELHRVLNQAVSRPRGKGGTP